jgi:hypothetical protein
MRVYLALGISLALLLPIAATAESNLSDRQIANILVKQSKAAYQKRRGPCACPEDVAADGSKCGRSSGYNRPGGVRPWCYRSDVPTAAISGYRAKNK